MQLSGGCPNLPRKRPGLTPARRQVVLDGALLRMLARPQRAVITLQWRIAFALNKL